MCGRFVAATDPDGVARFMVVDERQAPDLGPNYNVAPTQQVYAVAEHEGARHLVTFRWGLVPSWAKDTKIASKLINARSETAAEKPAFRTSMRKRRCLVPIDGFYEWQRVDGSKVPHFIHRADGAPFALAGLWSVWRDPDDEDAEPLRTCTILTTEANTMMRRLHDRMPVILEPSAWDVWLDRDVEDAEAVRHLMVPADPALLDAYPVSTEVNSTRNNHDGLILPVPA